MGEARARGARRAVSDRAGLGHGLGQKPTTHATKHDIRQKKYDSA